jgi:hypothetical protein
MTTELFDKVNFKKCPRNDCSFNGTPQPRTDFYKGRPECKTCSRRIGRAYAPVWAARRRSKVAVDRERRTKLPIEPWRNWLAYHFEVEGADALSSSLGIHERAVWRWLNESATADLDAVDRALCNRGTPWVLRELYPHIYDLPELEEAA